MSERRHVERFDDLEAIRHVRALKAYHDVLGVQTEAGAADLKRPADDIVQMHARYERHARGICNCPPPSVAGGTP